MLNKNLLILAASALCGTAYAADDSRWGSNSFSERPRDASSPPMIVEPFGGMPYSAMSTIDSRPGMVVRSIRESAPGYMGNARAGADREGWDEDRTVYRSSAPEATTDFEDNDDVRAGVTAGTGVGGASADTYVATRPNELTSRVPPALEQELALNQLHHLNRVQIGLAKIAESRAKSPRVLNLAHQIRADHEKMEKHVEQIADKHNIDLEGFQLSTYEQYVNDHLEDLEGSEFETTFLGVIGRSHDLNVASLRMIREDSGDPEIVALVEESLPTMHGHKMGSQFKGRAGLEEGDLGE